MRNVCLAMTFFRETLIILWSYSNVQLESRARVWVWVCACACPHTHTHSMSKKPVLNLVTKWQYLFICLRLQSEPLMCVWCFCKVDHHCAHIHVWRVSVISATHALFTFGHEMPVQSFWYHFGTLGTIYDLLYSNYAITLLLYQPSAARINWLEVCADCWDLSFSCMVLPTNPPPLIKKRTA
jgi:hypothetical protein